MISDKIERLTLFLKLNGRAQCPKIISNMQGTGRLESGKITRHGESCRNPAHCQGHVSAYGRIGVWGGQGGRRGCGSVGPEVNGFATLRRLVYADTPTRRHVPFRVSIFRFGAV